MENRELAHVNIKATVLVVIALVMSVAIFAYGVYSHNQTQPRNVEALIQERLSTTPSDVQALIESQLLPDVSALKIELAELRENQVLRLEGDIAELKTEIIELRKELKAKD